jgi:hypothetical protein
MCVTDNNKIANLISRNNDPHRLGETKEEWFMALIRNLMMKIGNNAITDEAHEFWNAAKTKQMTYGEVVAQRPLVDTLIASWPFCRYYAETDLYKPRAICKWVNISGAVSTPLPNIDSHAHLLAAHCVGHQERDCNIADLLLGSGV